MVKNIIFMEEGEGDITSDWSSFELGDLWLGNTYLYLQIILMPEVQLTKKY